jgi:hypothetical protein
MHVSISKASHLSGAARSTIYKDIEDGKLSVEINARGKKEINISELQRVYGDLKIDTKEDDNKVSQVVVPVSESSSKPIIGGGGQVAVLQERLESQKAQMANYEKTMGMLDGERQRERKQFQNQIDSLQIALEKSQEGQNKLTMLLEHKESDGTGDWEKAMKGIESRIANQEKEAKEDKERAQKILRQNQALKKALDAEKNKSFFQKLFG